jgi:hypothetical protein
MQYTLIIFSDKFCILRSAEYAPEFQTMQVWLNTLSTN